MTKEEFDWVENYIDHMLTKPMVLIWSQSSFSFSWPWNSVVCFG